MSARNIYKEPKEYVRPLSCEAKIISTEVTFDDGDHFPTTSKASSKNMRNRENHPGYASIAVIIMSLGMFPLGFFMGWAVTLSIVSYDDQIPFRAITIVYAGIIFIMLIDAIVLQFFSVGPLGRVSGKCLLIMYPTVVLIGIIIDVIKPAAPWPNMVWFTVMAMFMGRLPVSCITYVVECSSKNWRGAAGCLVYMFFAMGMTVSMATRTFIGSPKARAFSLHGILSACFYMIHVLLLYLLRESPWFLMEIGEQIDADLSIAWLRGDDPAMDLEMTEMEIYMSNDLAVSGSAMSAAWIGLNCILMHVLTGSFLVNRIYPKTLEVYDMHPFAKGVGAIWAAHFLGALCAVFLVDKLGRKFLLFVTLAVMSSCLIVLSVWSTFYTYSALDHVAMIVALIYSAAFGMGPASVSFVLMSEVMPITVRNVLTSVLFVVYWLLTFVLYILTRFYPLPDLGQTILFALLAAFCMERMFYVGVRCSFPETARRSLPRIQYIFSNF